MNPPLLAKQVQTRVEHTTLRSVCARAEIHFDPDPEHTLIEEDSDFVRAYYELPDDPSMLLKQEALSPWLLRLELDRAKMLDKQLSMAEVAACISREFQRELQVLVSDDNADKLIVRCRLINAGTAGSEGGKYATDSSTTVDEDVFLKRLEASMQSSIVLRGIPGIRRVFIVEHRVTSINPETGKPETRNEWVLETEGVAMREVMSHPDVDHRRVFSNDILEVYQVLGVEATRQTIMREMRKVIESDGSYVNYRHLAMLCDLMTSRGHLMGITRHGINRADTGALMRSSFEETVEILVDAAGSGEVDDCRGVSENIMMGQLAPVGTGSFDVLLDDLQLEQVTTHLPLDQPSQSFSAKARGKMTPGGFTPYLHSYAGASPLHDGSSSAWSNSDSPSSSTFAFSPTWNESLSAMARSPDTWNPKSLMTRAAYSPTSPQYYNPASPQYSPTSPAYNPVSPAYSPPALHTTPSAPHTPRPAPSTTLLVRRTVPPAPLTTRHPPLIVPPARCTAQLVPLIAQLARLIAQLALLIAPPVPLTTRLVPLTTRLVLPITLPAPLMTLIYPIRLAVLQVIPQSETRAPEDAIH